MILVPAGHRKKPWNLGPANDGFYLSLRQMAQTPKMTFDFFFVKMCRPRTCGKNRNRRGKFQIHGGGEFSLTGNNLVS